MGTRTEKIIVELTEVLERVVGEVEPRGVLRDVVRDGLEVPVAAVHHVVPIRVVVRARAHRGTSVRAVSHERQHNEQDCQC